MGTVYRARDLETNCSVALKLLQRGPATQPHELMRFEREANLLADLRHPGIVSYITHGRMEEGTPYLVMEWLDGEDLSTRLDRQRLTPAESRIVLERAAEALAVAHQRSIVHRDLKPSNLFLRDGDISRLTLLDFGIARRIFGARPMTRSGTVLGTLDYMAPEQARGQKDIGPSADIFSLGCVLYECLTGQPPFFGEEMAGVLAKILFEEVRPLRQFIPELSPAFESLIGRMLDKDPAKRPADASALLAEIAKLEPLTELELKSTAPLAPVKKREHDVLEDSEQLLYTVVVAIPRKARERSGPGQEANRYEDERPSPSVLRRLVSDFGAYSELLADGSLVAALAQTGAATDQVAQAARCALAVQERWPEARVALATGRAVLNERLPVGDAIDRAVRLARTHKGTQAGEDASHPRSTFDGVWLDEVSVGLLDTRFTVVQTERGPLLQGERMTVDESRPLLGKPTPCLGREHELGVLDVVLTSCIEESAARAVLVTAPPGIGKSRLRHEFQRRLQARAIDVEIFLGRGEPMSAGSPYALLNQAVRRLCGMQSGEPVINQRAKLRDRITRHLPPAEAPRILEFLGELCQLPFPDDASAKLRAARNDPKIMRDQIAHAVLAWLRAECKERPVLLILEDLHWGDILSTRLVDAALRQLHDQKLMVFGLARPEVAQVFPNLWEERRVQNIRLGPLSRKVCERLVIQILGQILGHKVRPEAMARIVEQAAGNALFLEELVRAHAEGKGDAMPETVLAMLQSRIARLEPGARRVLRAASLFGVTFWSGGVRGLYGSGRLTEQMEHNLRRLINSEIIERHLESRYPGEEEYSFRHSLMRDAAYTMLTEEDQSRGHRVVASYLERMGESDAIVLAEHLRRAGELERAVPYYLRAAEQSYDSNDSQGTLVRASQGEACGARGETLGRLRALQSLAHFWRAAFSDAFPIGLEAVALLPAGHVWWCRTMRHLFIIAGNISQPEKLHELGNMFLAAQPALDAHGPYTTAAAYMVTMYSLHGEREKARRFMDRMLKVGAGVVEQDLSARGFLKYGHGMYARFLLPEPWLCRGLLQESVDAFTHANDLRNLVLPQALLGTAQAALGEYQEGEATVRSSLALAERLGEPLLIVTATLYLAGLLVDRPGPEGLKEAHELALSTIERNASPNISGLAYSILSQVLQRQGQPSAAEEAGRKAITMLTMMRSYRITAYVQLMRALLAQGRGADACAIAKEARNLAAALDGCGFNEVSLRVSLSESFHAAGEIETAQAELRRAISELASRAENIPDQAARKRYLTEVPDNARVRELAHDWLEQGPGGSQTKS